VALDPSRRQRQNRIHSIESLNGRLIIDADDSGVLRRVQVQPGDVSRLCLKIEIVADHVTL
jgi:hypothetical protein